MLYIMRTCIYLPDELVTKVRNHCQNTGKTISGMIRIGLQKQLERAKDD